jgi:hypothetical protein
MVIPPFLVLITTLATASLAQPRPSDPVTELVEKYAPVLMHPHDEPNLPTNVDLFLPNCHLIFHNSACTADYMDFGTATFDLLESAVRHSSCDGHTYMASGTRSASRSRTFYLTDVPDNVKAGSSNPKEWATYYHVFENTQGGLNIQYWSFYAFNTGKKIGPVTIGSHGGDWEMVETVLDQNKNPTNVRTTGHTNIQSIQWTQLQLQGTHPVLFTEKGGHEAHSTSQEPAPWIVHQTWTNGSSTFPGGSPQPSGPLVDMGSRLKPKVRFLRYSGLWGSLGVTSFSSGYWGPAFNETGMPQDGFLAAWCDQMAPSQQVQSGQKECYPEDQQ